MADDSRQVPLPAALLARLDRRRGRMSHAAYIAALLDAEPTPITAHRTAHAAPPRREVIPRSTG